MKIRHLLLIPLMFSAVLLVLADDACPEEYAKAFPVKHLQTPDYIRLYNTLPPALQRELCRKDNTDWKPTADESAPRPLWDLFLNVLCVGECGQHQVLCTPDGNRILQVSDDAFGAIYCYVDVYTRQADGLWAKTNRFGFATRNVEFGKVAADNECVTMEFVDKELDLVIPERVPFSQEENYIGYRLDREQAWGGGFTPLTNEIYQGNVEHIRLMLESGKVDAEERDGWGLTPLEYTDPQRFAETFPDSEPLPHSGEIRELLLRHIGRASAEFVKNHPAEEPVPADYRLCKEWPGGKDGISLCLYEIQGPEGATGSVLRFRRDATGMLLREALPHISRYTQGHIPEMEAPELVWVPESMGLDKNILIVYESGRVRTPFSILELEWGSDCHPLESATLPPEGLPILSPLYQGTVAGYRDYHVLSQKGDKVFVDFYNKGDSPATGSTPNASFFIGTILPPKG